MFFLNNPSWMALGWFQQRCLKSAATMCAVTSTWFHWFSVWNTMNPPMKPLQFLLKLRSNRPESMSPGFEHSTALQAGNSSIFPDIDRSTWVWARSLMLQTSCVSCEFPIVLTLTFLLTIPFSFHAEGGIAHFCNGYVTSYQRVWKMDHRNQWYS